jgi:hypothetical protein
MKKYLGLAMVFALVVSVGPALAGESFHALSPLPDAQLATLTPLPDAQLATIEGTDKDGYKARHGKYDHKYDKYDHKYDYKYDHKYDYKYDKKHGDKKHGKDDVEVCIACFNIATVTQINVAVGSAFVDQLNAASVDQEIN